MPESRVIIALAMAAGTLVLGSDGEIRRGRGGSAQAIRGRPGRIGNLHAHVAILKRRHGNDQERTVPACDRISRDVDGVAGGEVREIEAALKFDD